MGVCTPRFKPSVGVEWLSPIPLPHPFRVAPARDPEQFFANLSSAGRQDVLETLRRLYQRIVLDYFQSPPQVEAQVDAFVQLAYRLDLPISRILEIHMELMADISKQLKLEHRSEDILLDYRLTLIDVMANLCETYRRATRQALGYTAEETR